MSSSSYSQQSSSYQRDIARRLKDAFDKRSLPDFTRMCDCGGRLQMLTSWTEMNPCRRFSKCRNNACKHFAWLDKPAVLMYAKDCLNLLISEYGELLVELESLETKFEEDSSSGPMLRECERMEKEIVKMKSFIAGIVIGILFSIVLVLISK